MRVAPLSVVELNDAVALAMRDGPAAGSMLVDGILARDDLREYHLARAARADLCRRLAEMLDTPSFPGGAKRPSCHS